MAYGFCGDLAIFGERISAARTVAEDQSIGFYLHGLIPAWWAQGAVGQVAPEDIVTAMEGGLLMLEGAGLQSNVPFLLAVMAQALAKAGRYEEACSVIERAFAMLEANEDHFNEPELYRIAGDLARDRPGGNIIQAEEKYHLAIDAAQSQSAKSWELRAATSLAKLWQSQGKNQEAHDLLAPIYDWFTEGFDTADLKEAKALLEELKLM